MSSVNIQKCPHCSDGAIEHDAALGTAVCTSCGAVLEENAVVSEVTFAELGNGATVLEGHFIAGDRGKAALPTVFGRRLGDPRRRDDAAVPESREVTLSNGKRRLQALAAAVGVHGEHAVDAAHRWYALALNHQFTRGRRGNNVIAACLYIVCRLERTPHMLLDFSDVLRTSVYSLGGTYLRLVRLLNLSIPVVDPAFYVARFAARLDFGERTAAVVHTANRVVAQMKRDWIQAGRRPAGVCAAGLLIAARVHGFRRTEAEVVRVVRICEATLRRRLDEFGRTPAAALTPAEFHGVVLEAAADPPSFTAARAGRVSRRSRPIAAQNPASYAYSWAPPADEAPLESLDGDGELEAMLLGADEVAVKTALWTELNREFIEKEAERDRVRAMEEAARATEIDVGLPSGDEEPASPRKKRASTATGGSTSRAQKRKPIAPGEAASAADAARSVLQTRRLSRKINYERLGDLFSQGPT